MNFKPLTKSFFQINIIIILIIMVGMSVYDPLHIFHKSWITKNNRIHGNMRLQAAGIINNYNFDSIIMGTSMMKGTSSLSASKKIGGEFVNLSSDGSSVYERQYIINYAFKKKNVKTVILSFDTGLDLNIQKFLDRFSFDRFNFLYDETSFNDMKAYWNYKFVGCLATFSTSTYCLGSKREIQRPIEWFYRVYKINKNTTGIENWVHGKKGRGKSVYSRIQRHLKKPIDSKIEYEKKLQLTQDIIESGLFKTIKDNDGVDFHLMFPPYSRFLYSLWMKKNPYKYLLYKETTRYLVVNGSKYKNLKIYSFDDMQYLDDLNNYRDMRHYNTDMNEIMLEAIRDQKHILNKNMFDDFIKSLDKINSNYPLGKELNYLLNSYS